MPLEQEDGTKVLQLITSRYNQREWRKKIEKTLSLPPSGFKDGDQRKIFLYLKIKLQAYKSRRADPPSWIVGGFATQEVIERAKVKPEVVDPDFTQEQISFLGNDPGDEINDMWWEEMLVHWFEDPEEEELEDSEIPGSSEPPTTATPDDLTENTP